MLRGGNFIGSGDSSAPQGINNGLEYGSFELWVLLEGICDIAAFGCMKARERSASFKTP